MSGAGFAPGGEHPQGNLALWASVPRLAEAFAGFAVLGIIAAVTLIKTADSEAMKGAEAVPVAA